MKEPVWINPIGGLGDALMLSGVLKAAHDEDPSRRFHLIRRTKYLSILAGHPAIQSVGFPPKGAHIIGTDYWSRNEYAAGGFHAMDILARMLGLPEKGSRKLYIPPFEEDDAALAGFIPWRKTNVLIAPASDSPRKEMHPLHWEGVAKRLQGDGCLVAQAGNRRAPWVRGAYSLTGLTTPRELVVLIGRFDAVITSDNFIMHAAHLAGVPAVVLWGPTDERRYGYPGQYHLRAYPACRRMEQCIGPGLDTYAVPCEEGPADHCMNRIGEERIYFAASHVLAGKGHGPDQSKPKKGMDTHG